MAGNTTNDISDRDSEESLIRLLKSNPHLMVQRMMEAGLTADVFAFLHLRSVGLTKEHRRLFFSDLASHWSLWAVKATEDMSSEAGVEESTQVLDYEGYMHSQ